ncbi:MAG TPA: hypothetical protein VNQ90_16310 [Chthoniobacteraceae bacterium]|nr:hypothetical protein [Chthoniobacteraceae bacterium]
MEKDVQSQIQELEERIRQLRSSQLEELQAKLAEARATVASLEAEIAEISGSAPTAAKTPAAGSRRKRTSSEEVRGRILKALSEVPEGLSQKEISEMTGLNYNTVALYLKNNSDQFKTTGALRSKRYFLR